MNIKQLARTLKNMGFTQRVYIYKDKNKWVYVTDVMFAKQPCVRYTALSHHKLNEIEREIQDLFYKRQENYIKECIKSLG